MEAYSFSSRSRIDHFQSDLGNWFKREDVEELQAKVDKIKSILNGRDGVTVKVTKCKDILTKG